MLLQAACLARLGHELNHGGDPFIVTALYFQKTGGMDRYFVFSPNPDNPEVCMNSDQTNACPQFLF